MQVVQGSIRAKSMKTSETSQLRHLGMSPRRNERTPENFGNTSGRKGYITWSAQGVKRRMADVIDGTSNSIMVSEKHLPASRHGADGGDNERWNNAGWDECVVRYHFPPSQMPTRLSIGLTTDWTGWYLGHHLAPLLRIEPSWRSELYIWRWLRAFHSFQCGRPGLDARLCHR